MPGTRPQAPWPKRTNWRQGLKNFPSRGAHFSAQRPGSRRRYDREYKPRLRGHKGVTNSGQTPVRKAYICFRFPELELRRIAFRNGWFVTDNPEEQARIEQKPLYGIEIFSWRLDS